MKNWINNWKAPTPEAWKKVIRWSLSLSAGSVALLTADTLGKAVMPDFSFKLLPWVVTVAKNVFVAGLFLAAVAKFQKEDTDNQRPAAPKDDELQNKQP